MYNFMLSAVGDTPMTKKRKEKKSRVPAAVAVRVATERREWRGLCL